MCTRSTFTAKKVERKRLDDQLDGGIDDDVVHDGVLRVIGCKRTLFPGLMERPCQQKSDPPSCSCS
jgi:hypothetical protein